MVEIRQTNLKAMWGQVKTSIETTIFTPLNEMIDILSNKLQTLTIKKVIGGGTNGLKKHSMYRSQTYY